MPKLFSAFLIVIASTLSVAHANQLTGQEILEKVANQPKPKSTAVKMDMLLLTRRGDKTYEQKRQVTIYGTQDGKAVKSLLKFTEPKDVEGVTLLMTRGKEAESSEQWLYMPVLGQDPRQVSGAQKDKNFLGTDFTFGDLEGVNPEDWDSKFLRDEACGEQTCWVLESTPKNLATSQYTKTTQWIRQDIAQPVKIEFYNAKGLLKTLSAEDFQQVDSYWIAHKTTMDNVQASHATVLTILEQKNNLDIPDTVFTTRYMRGS